MSSRRRGSSSATRSELRKLWSKPQPRPLVPGNPAGVRKGQIWVTTDPRRNSGVFVVAQVLEDQGRAIIEYTNGYRCFVRLDRFDSSGYGAAQRGYRLVTDVEET